MVGSRKLSNDEVEALLGGLEGDDEQAKRLGQLIGIAVQSEIVEQQRPGGLLA